MAEDRWFRVAVRVMEFVDEHRGRQLSIGEIAYALELDPWEVMTELDTLCAENFVRGEIVRAPGDDPGGSALFGSALSEKGLRQIGVWPSDDPYEALLQVIDRQIEVTEDSGQRSKLQRLKSTVADVGKAAVAGLLAEFAKGSIH